MNVAACPDMIFAMDSSAPHEAEEPDEDRLDVQLMLRVQAGDMEAFATLIERHQNRVIGTVARMLGEYSEAEDLAQQVFLRIWKSSGRYQARAKFTTWLYTITRNLVFNESRRRKRHPGESMDAQESDRHQYADTPSARPDAQLLEGELQHAIQAAIASLPEQQRMAVILRRYEDLSYEEIAETLSTSVSSVKSLLFRARTTLREQLGNYLRE